jgi:hypothetical protein
MWNLRDQTLVRTDDDDAPELCDPRADRQRMLTEASLIADAVVSRIANHRLPPDEAYWWVRIVCESMRRELGRPW